MNPNFIAVIVFLLALFSTLRLTRLAVHDTIAQPWRDKLILGYHQSLETAPRRAKVYDFASELFGCPWCIGFWISAGVSAVALAASAPAGIPLWFAWPAYTLTISYLTGAIYTAVFTLEEYEPNGGQHQ